MSPRACDFAQLRKNRLWLASYTILTISAGIAKVAAADFLQGDQATEVALDSENGGIEALIVLEQSAGSSQHEFAFVPENAAEFNDDDLKAELNKLPPDLQVLDLSLAESKVRAGGVRALAESLPHVLRNLTLNMFRANVTDDGWKALASALPASLIILDINLKQTGLSDVVAEAFVKGLPSGLKSLTINLEDTQVADAGLKALASALPQSLIDLDLRLQNTVVNDSQAAALARGLPRGLRGLTMNFEDTKVSDVGMKAWASELPKTLLSLKMNFEGSKVRDAGLEAFGSGLPDGLKVLSMQVHGCDVSAEGIKAFVNGFPDSLQSITLDLHSTKLGDSTLEAVLSSLPENLRSLDLDFGLTNLSDSGGWAFATKELPSGLETLYMRAWITDVGDKWMEALAKALPNSLKKLAMHLDHCKVGDDGMKALAERLPESCEFLSLNVGFCPIGDRGLRDVCAAEAMDRAGAHLRVLAPGTFITQLGAEHCKPAGGAVWEVKYDSSPQPWPKRINDLIHNENSSGVSFDCRPQDWIIHRNEIGHTAWQRASAMTGPDSDIVQCLEDAGGHPGTLDQITLTLSRPKTWSTFAMAMGLALILACLRIVSASLRQEQNKTENLSIIAAPLWFRNFEVAAHLLTFCGPVMLALDTRISTGIFAVGFVLVAFAEHGWRRVLDEPVFTFASRTKRGFVYSCLRTGVLAHVAWAFSAHAGMLCQEETHYSHAAYANLTEYSCAPHFRSVQLFGVYDMSGDAWEKVANSHLAIMSYNKTWQTERLAIQLLGQSLPTLEINLKLVFDTYVYGLLTIGLMCPIVVLVWLAVKVGTARYGENLAHLEEKPEIQNLLEKGKTIVEAERDFFERAKVVIQKAKAVIEKIRKFNRIPLFFADVFLDASLIFRMLWTEHYRFAVILMTVWLASLFEEVWLGDIFHLRKHVDGFLEKGELPEEFQRILAREASFDCCVSLAVTAYALPYTCQTTYAMITGALTMLSSGWKMGGYLHTTLDLHQDVIHPEEEKGYLQDTEMQEVL